MMLSKVDPLADALELLEEINKMVDASEKGPVRICCHCTVPDYGSILLCIWCKVKLFLESRKGL